MWNDFINQEASVWNDFHNYWLKHPYRIPTYLVRYEDLLSKPEQTLTGVFKFLLSLDNLNGFEQKIKKAVSE